MPTTAKINGPSRHVTDHQYPDECKSALEASVESLMTKAIAAGWEPRQAAYSLMILAAETLQGFSLPGDVAAPDA
jgi:hypothetical protein